MQTCYLLPCLALGAAIAPAIAAQTTANVALVSDYHFRGISQTDEQPAVQGGLDYAGESGFYIGTWLSNTDFNPPGEESSGVEVDVYAGYSFDVGAGSLTLGVITYQYPSIDDSLEEVTVGYSIGDFEGSVWHDWDNDTTYYTAGYSWAFDRDISLGVVGGFFDPDQGDDYLHYGVSVSKPIADSDWTLTLTDTDIDSDDVTLLLGIAKEFEF